MLDELKPKCAPAFLDSGAYSVSTGKFELDIDEYIRFTNKNHKHFRLISVPDVIGNFQETVNNADYFLKHSTAPREKITNVYHLTSGKLLKFPDIVKQSVDAGLETIAIGGMVGFPRNQAIVALEWIYNYIHKNNVPLKTHLFGGGDPMIVKLFKPDSIDSASFIHTACGLSYLLYDFDNWKIKKDKLSGIRKKYSRQYITDEAVEYLLQNSELILPFDNKANDRDYVYHAIENISEVEKVLLVSGLNVRMFEKYAKKHLNYDFKYYVTFWDFNRFQSLYLASSYREVWRERTLIAYPEFRELSGRVHEKLLKTFGELDENR